MDVCPVCRIKYAQYDRLYSDCVCHRCLLMYPKLTCPIDGLSMAFRNTHSNKGFQAVIEGRDADREIHIFYMNGVCCYAAEGVHGGIIYTKYNQ